MLSMTRVLFPVFFLSPFSSQKEISNARSAESLIVDRVTQVTKLYSSLFPSLFVLIKLFSTALCDRY
jgi:hypothetical protein